ncbi:MAG: dTDP-4-dehydrorhamnose 3,5-epimerase [Candidatus Binatia bacterium]|jgi:dTDP-4-dehydrorhamnose 3,5-epimerase
MEVLDLPLDGLKLIKPRVHRDGRGFFVESFRQDALAGLPSFVQDNHSRSVEGTMRGLHFQTAPGQAKLVRVATGKVFDVAVDIRKDSPTFGKWHGEILDDVDCAMMFLPVGFAHGFCVLSDTADVLYQCSAYYDPQTEAGFKLDDAEVGVRWPIDPATAILSRRDRDAKSFREVFR